MKKTSKQDRERDADRAWGILVGLVMDTRGDWRRKVVETTGLPFSRTRALRRLVKAPLTMGALAEALTTDPPATTVIVNDLEERGLVRRDAHPDDRRTKIVSLTPEGKRVARAASPGESAPAAFDRLEDEDVATLLRIATRLRDG
jgi:DNA-binding MarR family transcriptional regulator